jgi:pantetheine-phosphate adenylyltransferase
VAIALVPGSFDPVTYGHLDIIRRTKGLFQEVRVLVARNSSKTSLFTTEERVEMLGQLCAEMDRVVVDSFDGLLVDYARQHGATAIVKGLRFVSDFEYELQMALANHRLNSELETVFLPTGLQYSDLSSSIVKEIARHGGAVEGLVPEIVQQRLRAKYANGNE